MTLQSAETAKAGSDTNRSVPDVSNVTIVEIDALITTAKGNGLYRIDLNRIGRMLNNGIQIKQTDDSYINIETIIYALTEGKYRAVYKKKNISSGFKINISVAWN